MNGPIPVSGVAIDLGTANTVVSVRRANGDHRLHVFDGNLQLPSGVFRRDDGSLSTGLDARIDGQRLPERYEPHPKRHIDDGRIDLGEDAIEVVHALAAVLRRVKDEVLPSGPATVPVVLTVPATWSPARRATLTRAAEQAGIPAPSLVSEPLAAVRHYLDQAGQLADGHALAVYDLGAGTFDVTVFRRDGAALDMMVADSRDDLGGLAIDEALARYLLVRAETDWEKPADIIDPSSRRELYAAVRQAKEQLSRRDETVVVWSGFDRDVRLSRLELEETVEPVIGQTVRSTYTAIHGMDLPAERVAAIILIGGGSQMPMVAKLLGEKTGIATVVMDDPQFAIASGALAELNGGEQADVAAPTPALDCAASSPIDDFHRSSVALPDGSTAPIAEPQPAIDLPRHAIDGTADVSPRSTAPAASPSSTDASFLSAHSGPPARPDTNRPNAGSSSSEERDGSTPSDAPAAQPMTSGALAAPVQLIPPTVDTDSVPVTPPAHPVHAGNPMAPARNLTPQSLPPSGSFGSGYGPRIDAFPSSISGSPSPRVSPGVVVGAVLVSALIAVLAVVLGTGGGPPEPSDYPAYEDTVGATQEEADLGPYFGIPGSVCDAVNEAELAAIIGDGTTWMLMDDAGVNRTDTTEDGSCNIVFTGDGASNAYQGTIAITVSIDRVNGQSNVGECFFDSECAGMTVVEESEARAWTRGGLVAMEEVDTLTMHWYQGSARVMILPALWTIPDEAAFNEYLIDLGAAIYDLLIEAG
ncbi:Hsp70 family protein [Stackebrandtia soli]|uniref:Hsp70 family protein n=1 Tax=Stackebrandtia soli TaxID=1892856 RepID=UPI0039EA4A58